jgi:hypothetical protein
MKHLRLTGLAFCGLWSATGLAQPAARQPQAEQQAPAILSVPVDYGQPASWLCLPGRDDVCSRPLPTTALNPNGYGSVGQSLPARNAAVDCFYVYPTISRDKTDNSDLIAGPEELAAVTVQFARFGSVCRTFAPLYRQATLAALGRQAAGDGSRTAATMNLAYGDVRAAWRQYLRQRNGGRPFVLIGHSQGTIHLNRLLAEEIENGPAAKQMLSAMLIGFNVEVPEGKLVGGTFKKTPLCTRVGETGCVVTYVSFRAGSPPPAGALFGRATKPGMTVACTNPARFARGNAPLDSYWYSGPSLASAANPIEWSTSGPPPTPFVRTDGLVSAACVNKGQAGYLAVTVNANPRDARTDRIPGDVTMLGQPQPGWGLHLADMSLAQGDLIGLVQAQAEAFKGGAANKGAAKPARKRGR